MRVKRNPCDVIVLKTILIPKKRSDILGCAHEQSFEVSPHRIQLALSLKNRMALA